MKRLTNDDYQAMRDSEDWGALWKAAIPWVKFAISSFKVDSRDDATQEVLLRIGEQLKKWDPAKGAFTQFILSKSRYELLDYLRRAKGRSKSGREKFHNVELDFDPDFGDEYGNQAGALEPSYADAETVPQGFGDPGEELTRLGAHKAAEAFLGRLEPGLALRFRERWGLPLLDSEAGEETDLTTIAASRGTNRTAVRRQFETARKFLLAGQNRVDVNDTTSIYPPKGRDRWPKLKAVEDRLPGFWNSSVSSAMGDIAIWRESVGATHGDWSWRPSDLDVMRGCKR